MDTPATFNDRTAAWVLDLIPFQLGWLVLLPNAQFNTMTVPAALAYAQRVLIVSAIMFALYACYHIACERLFSTTYGKYLLGVRVQYTNDAPTLISVGLRFFGCCLSWLVLNIGHAMMRVRSDRKTLQDLLSNTQVVYDPWTMLGTMPPLSAVARRSWKALAFMWVGAWCIVSVYQTIAALNSIIG